MLMLQAKEYQVLSDVPGATAGLGHEHGLTAEQQRHWDRKLSTAEVPSEVMQASLIFSADMAGGLVRFQDLKHFGIKQVCRPAQSSACEAVRCMHLCDGSLISLIVVCGAKLAKETSGSANKTSGSCNKTSGSCDTACVQLPSRNWCHFVCLTSSALQHCSKGTLAI